LGTSLSDGGLRNFLGEGEAEFEKQCRIRSPNVNVTNSNRSATFRLKNPAATAKFKTTYRPKERGVSVKSQRSDNFHIYIPVNK